MFTDECWIIEKAKEYKIEVNICFTDYSKTLNCVNRVKFWNVLKNNGVPEHLIILMKNLYTDQETTVIIKIGNTDRSQTEKELRLHTNHTYLTPILNI